MGPVTEAELGYRLRRARWRRGLAVEGARELVRYGSEELALKRIWAKTMAVNLRSRAVMERLGMRHTSTEVRSWEHPIEGADQGEVTYTLWITRPALQRHTFRRLLKVCLCRRVWISARRARAPRTGYTGLRLTGESGYLRTLVTRPEPTVRPPSRMENGWPSSMAMGWISVTTISVLSPGMTISVPSGSLTTPVTSVVRK